MADNGGVEFFELVRVRRSVRAFEPREVEEEKVQAILRAANLAPSAGNLQAYEIYLVRRREDRMALARASLDQLFAASAPLMLVFCAHAARSSVKYGERGERLYSIQDATIACAFAMLAAADLGLGTVWIGAFHDQAVHRALGSPPGVRPVAILPIGYPAEKPEPAGRRSLAELVHEM